MAERIDPMQRIAQLAANPAMPVHTTEPLAGMSVGNTQSPTTGGQAGNDPGGGMVERVCAHCQHRNCWDSAGMPPAACCKCATPWNKPTTIPVPIAEVAAAAAAPVALATHVKKGRPKKATTAAAPVGDGANDGGVVEGGAMEAAPVDGASVREVIEARVRELAAKYKLNELAPVQVGTGTVFSIGFTRWQTNDDGERLPKTYYKQLTDDAATFRALFDAVAGLDRTVAMDTALVSGLSAELAEIAYRGEVEASLWNGKAGRVAVMPGAKVRLGARLSKKGRLLFTVLGPA